MAEQKKINIRNKRATFDYEILEEWVAGVVLVGTEIKSIRAGKVSMTDSYCYFDKGELWIRGVNIAEYDWGTCNNHAPRRDRKLLLTHRELEKLARASQDRGLTIVGLRLFLNEPRDGQGDEGLQTVAAPRGGGVHPSSARTDDDTDRKG